MWKLLPVVAAAALSQAPNPYTLPIGTAGTLKLEPGALYRTSDGAKVTPAEVAAASKGLPFVFLGESHDNAEHHRMQADIIQALAASGRKVSVGMEMFTRPVQAELDPWGQGKYTEEEFIEKSQWKTQWGFDYALYKPIFEVVLKEKLPLIALNVPRDWVRAVGRGGLAALTEEQKAQLPKDFDLSNKDHRAVFTALMGGHPMTGAQGENVYSAQVLWDEAMADTALKFIAKQEASEQNVFAVVAGSGHVMYGQGINYRVKKRSGKEGLTVMMLEAADTVEVAKGIGEYVYVTKAKE